MPEGWTRHRGTDLFEFVTSGSRGWAKYYSADGPAFLRIGNLDRGTISLDLRDVQHVRPPTGTEGTRTRVLPNDVLVSITADIGSVGIVPEGFGDAYINQHIALVRLRGGVNARYVAWFVASPEGQRQLSALQRGATKKGLGLDDIRSLSVPCAPGEVQARIVAEIEKQFTRLDAGVEALKRLQAHLRRYRAAVLEAACEGRLVRTEAAVARAAGRDYESGQILLAKILNARRALHEGGGSRRRYAEPAAPLAGKLALPEAWAWATIEQLSSKVDYGSSSKTREEPVGVPVLRMGNITDGSLDTSNLKYLPVDHDEFPGLLLRSGDVLFNRTNSPELVGKTAVYRGQPSPCSFASYLIRVRLVEGYSPHLLAAFINSAYGREWIKRVVVQQVGQANVNGTKLQALAVPVPPMAEQNRIVAALEERLSEIVMAKDSVERALARAVRLRSAVLRAAFEGRLVSEQPDRANLA